MKQVQIIKDWLLAQAELLEYFGGLDSDNTDLACACADVLFSNAALQLELAAEVG